MDNASTVEDRAVLGEIVSSSTLSVRVLWSDVNDGFAAGSNMGIRLAFQQGADWAVLINNDALAGGDAVASLRQMLAGIQPAIVALPLLERGAIVLAGRIQWLSSTLPHMFKTPRPNDRIYAVGGGMAIHRAIFQRIGPLDERYFLYFEDAEYSERARYAGYPIQTADIPALSHEVSATTSRLGSPLLLHYHMRNALLFNQTHGPWWVRATLPFWAGLVMLKQGIKFLALPSRRPAARAIAAGIVDYYSGHYGRIA